MMQEEADCSHASSARAKLPVFIDLGKCPQNTVTQGRIEY